MSHGRTHLEGAPLETGAGIRFVGSPPEFDVVEDLLGVLELYDLAKVMMRVRLAEALPDASTAEIDRRLARWALKQDPWG